MEYPKTDDIEFIKEFVRRSKMVYEAVVTETEFETTALINCALGLFIIPKSKNLGDISDDSFYMAGEPIRNTYTDSKYDKKQLLRHIRNSLSHGRFHLNSNENHDVSSIMIEDKNGKMSFSIELKIDLFRKIVVEYMESIRDSYNFRTEFR